MPSTANLTPAATILTTDRIVATNADGDTVGVLAGGLPISTATQTAINSEASTRAAADTANSTAISDHTARTDNPHAVTFAQLGGKPTTLAGYGITDAVAVDVATFGASPSASAAVNRAAFQAAFDYIEAQGGGQVIISRAGEYLLDTTLFYPSNITIRAAEGVVLKKSTTYGEVMLNKGALNRTWNDNVTIEGITFDVSAGGVPRQNMWGMMSELGAYYVRKLKIINFRCETIHASQFCIHLCRAEDVTIINPYLLGHKDAIHYSGGCKRVTVINPTYSNHDDANGINAGDYVECTPELGDIEDITIINPKDLVYSGGAYGYFVRMLPASWGSYANGITTVRRGTTVVNNGRIYRCVNDVGAGPYTTSVAPTHTTLNQIVTGADSIAWMCLQVGTITSASVRRVKVITPRHENPRSGSLYYANIISDTFDQSVTPGSEALSEVTEVVIDKPSIKTGLGSTLISSNSNLKSLRIAAGDGIEQLGCVFGNSSMSGNVALTTPATTTDIVFHGNIIKTAMSNFMDLRRANTTVRLFAAGNSAPNSAFSCYQTGATTFRLPFCDIPISTGASGGGGSVSVSQGDIIKTTSSLGGWLIGTAANGPKAIAAMGDDLLAKTLEQGLPDVNDTLIQFWHGTSTSYGWKWLLNGASTGDIQLYRRVAGTDTEVIRFARSSGRVTFAEHIVVDGGAGKTLRITNGVANGSVATTLGSVGPTGATAGNPQGWMRISVNGTDRFIPYW